MTLSLDAGEITDIPEYIDTLSDGSAGGIEPNSITFDICRKVIDEMLLIEESEIKKAIRFAFDTHKKVIEGAAGVALAALINNFEKFNGQTVVVVLCGANIQTEKLLEILND